MDPTGEMIFEFRNLEEGQAELEPDFSGMWKWRGPNMKEDDPIASDPVLLHTWTRYVGILIALLAISVGASSTDEIDLSSIVGP